jgi:prepilin-type N-terminal cleavage/methylation domain-containing protein
MTTGRARRVALGREQGFTMTELVVVAAMIGLVFAMTIPFFVSYYQAAALSSGAQAMRGLLEQGRQLAIQQNTTFCIKLPTSTQLQYFANNTCTGTAWAGAGTDINGNISLPQGVTVTSTANPVFNYLGAATTAAVYTVTNTTTASTLTVTIGATGRMSIP